MSFIPAKAIGMKRYLDKVRLNPGAASLALFAREILVNPRAMGAACPSAPALAGAMAGRAPLEREGLVVELGGGTGAVTAALLRHGVSPWQLVVIERSPTLVRHLRHRFPQLRVLQGDAAQLSHLLGAPRPRLNCLISSLPLRSLPPLTTRAIIQQWQEVLEPGGLLVQFTYDLRGTHARLLPGFRRVSAKIVWNNLPPARVEVFERI